MEKDLTTVVEIPVTEYERVSQLILHLIGIEDFLSTVEQDITDIAKQSPERYFSNNIAEITEDDIAKSVETIFQSEYGEKFDVPSVVYEHVAENINRDLLGSLEGEIMEWFHEAKEYERDPLGYHGLSQQDFI